MNRRSFITKALAGLAAVPLIGKMIQAKPQLPPACGGPLEYRRIPYVMGSVPMSFYSPFQRPRRTVTITLHPKAFSFLNGGLPAKGLRFGLVDSHGDHEFEIIGAEISGVPGFEELTITGSVMNCRDHFECRLACGGGPVPRYRGHDVFTVGGPLSDEQVKRLRY